ARAVDRVNNPAAPAGASFATAFLTQDAVIRELTLYGLANQAFVFPVGNRNRGCIRLRLCRNAMRTYLLRVLACRQRKTASQFQFSLVAHRLLRMLEMLRSVQPDPHPLRFN